jgi:hypothetical protein
MTSTSARRPRDPEAEAHGRGPTDRVVVSDDPSNPFIVLTVYRGPQNLGVEIDPIAAIRLGNRLIAASLRRCPADGPPGPRQSLALPPKTPF